MGRENLTGHSRSDAVADPARRNHLTSNCRRPLPDDAIRGGVDNGQQGCGCAAGCSTSKAAAK